MAKDIKAARPREIPKENEFKGFKIVFNDLKQRNVEKWLADLDSDEKITPRRLGNIVRAAFKAGWFELPVLSVSEGDDPILEWPPSRVNWLSNLITDKYQEVMYFDPS